MSNNEKKEPKVPRIPNNSRRVARKERDPLQERVKKLEKLLHDKSENPGFGRSPIDLIQSYKPEAFSPIYNSIAREAGMPTSSVYTAAVAKMREHLIAENPESRELIMSLSLHQFACVVALDDWGSVAKGLVQGATALYNIPVVKNFVDSSISKGYNAIKDYLFKPSQLTPLPSFTSMSGDKFDTVSLDHLFGSMTKDITVASDPVDIPKLVYTNKLYFNVTMTVNTSGAGCLFFCGWNWWNTGLNSATAFQGLNINNNYNPDLSVSSGTFVYSAGPLAGSSTAFNTAKFLGMEVNVQPFVSLNSSEGGYVAGFFQDAISTQTTGSVMDTNVISFSNLSQIPGFRVSNMKTSGSYRSIPSSERSNGAEWIGVGNQPDPRPDYGTFAIIVKGADPSATIDFQVALAYSVMPTKTAMNLIKGSLPPLAPFTDQFMEFLRVRYPDIGFWPPEQIVRLYEKMRTVEPTYTSLVKVSHSYKQPITRMPMVQEDFQEF